MYNMLTLLLDNYDVFMLTLYIQGRIMAVWIRDGCYEDRGAIVAPVTDIHVLLSCLLLKDDFGVFLEK